MKQNALRIFLKNVWVMLAGVAVMLSAQAGAAEFVVKVKNNFVLQQFAQSLGTTVGAQVIDQHPDGRLLLVSTNDKSGHTILTRIRKLAEVEYAVENIKLYALEAPDDPHYSKQWALEKVNAEAAWERQRGSHDVVVAVIDTGIAWNHEDLSENIWINEGEIAGNGIDDDGNGFKDDVRGWDFRDNDNNPDDLTSNRNPGHGTHCAGIVGAIGNNGVGISGMAQSVRLMPVRFLGADGSGDLMSGAKAIDYAVKNNADIISASWGAKVSRSQIAPILEAIQREVSIARITHTIGSHHPKHPLPFDHKVGVTMGLDCGALSVITGNFRHAVVADVTAGRCAWMDVVVVAGGETELVAVAVMHPLPQLGGVQLLQENRSIREI